MTHRTKIVFVFSLIFLLGAAGAFVGSVWYIKQLGGSLNEKVRVIADSYAREQAYADLTTLLEDTESERTELKRYVLSENDTIGFLSTIESIGVEQGVKLTTNSLDVVEVSNTEKHLEIDFSIVGQEPLVKRMLLILESIPYHSTLTDVSLVREGNEAQLKVTLEVTLY